MTLCKYINFNENVQNFMNVQKCIEFDENVQNLRKCIEFDENVQNFAKMYRKVVIGDTKAFKNSDYNQLRASKVNTAMGNPLWGTQTSFHFYEYAKMYRI